ncbi:hydroxymethylpyrimidine/phosphomethylpyrimidine kinase [Pontibacter sp. G13]|uniref:hydroxymethylpyrimidine/phosphomethylpyrimidine kinase n=1 Tax=Pontibacter sp. G13 TaxID=3074898 RepID=UPI00288B3E1C|nr:hydroxymethylpyrimidine/phosphomethylpyrimidine kinase [Pontibacter sp. G13]WNJ18968.1 hydroxymethylpyrimidine/phosphomethylpyrimidine kinase [Pontibacter sp. G13]
MESAARPYVLTIAGFDPCSGAGLTSDLKTIEQLGGYGLAVCTANTIQTDSQFFRLKWESPSWVIRQLQEMLKRYPVSAVKIGIVESPELLLSILREIVSFNRDIAIVWDPILKASTGFDFQPDHFQGKLKQLLKEGITVMTPNFQEMEKLVPDMEPAEAAKKWSKHGAILLKGGHRADAPGEDLLFDDEHKEVLKAPTRAIAGPKHGSGCVLSAAIATHLALGHHLKASCKAAKSYITQFLNSNDSLLGYHANLKES